MKAEGCDGILVKGECDRILVKAEGATEGRPDGKGYGRGKQVAGRCSSKVHCLYAL